LSARHVVDKMATRALDLVIESVAPGMATAELVTIGDEALAAAGTRPDQPGGMHASGPAHWGHDLGLVWERPWLVSFRAADYQEGLVLAIERAITLARVGAVAAEQNFIVTGSGADLLTAGPAGKWT
jgi:Xaa-Pro aminopeptidase